MGKPLSPPLLEALRCMPDKKLRALCESIGQEHDPAKLTALIEQLIEVLAKEQDAIKAVIHERIAKFAGGSQL